MVRVVPALVSSRIYTCFSSENFNAATPNTVVSLCSQVPLPVCRLTCLCKLSLACNALTVVPAALGSLTSLQFLDVSFNKIEVLPPELSSLVELESLNLGFNPIGKLSGGMMPRPALQMTALKELNMDYTGCREMDLMLGQLICLKALKVCVHDTLYMSAVPPSVSPGGGQESLSKFCTVHVMMRSVHQPMYVMWVTVYIWL